MARVRPFYDAIVPGAQAFDVAAPDCLFRRFSDDGSLLLAVSRPQQARRGARAGRNRNRRPIGNCEALRGAKPRKRAAENKTANRTERSEEGRGQKRGRWGDFLSSRPAA